MSTGVCGLSNGAKIATRTKRAIATNAAYGARFHSRRLRSRPGHERDVGISAAIGVFRTSATRQPWIDDPVGEVDEHVHEDDDRGDHERDSLHHGIVALRD